MTTHTNSLLTHMSVTCNNCHSWNVCSGAHRPQLRHVPPQVLSSVHHLQDDPIHFLSDGGDRDTSHAAPASRCYDRLQTLTELSRTPLPSLSYSLNATGGGGGVDRKREREEINGVKHVDDEVV